MCVSLSDNDIGYSSLSSYDIMRSLKILDVRGTAAGNQLISSIYKSPSIQELYFYCLPDSFHMDTFRRTLAAQRSLPGEPYCSTVIDGICEGQEIINNMSPPPSPPIPIGGIPAKRHKMDTVDDRGVEMYRYVSISNAKFKRPKSFLFKDPYPECKCNYKKPVSDNKSSYDYPRYDESSSDSDDEDTIVLKNDIKNYNRQLQTLLTKKRTALKPCRNCVLKNRMAKKKQSIAGSSKSDEQKPGEDKASSSQGTVDENHSIWQHFKIPLEMFDLLSRTKLRRLSLRGYPCITDISLQFLMKFPLELLDVTHTNVTERGVRHFLSRHPQCIVLHESACLCSPEILF